MKPLHLLYGVDESSNEVWHTTVAVVLMEERG